MTNNNLFTNMFLPHPEVSFHAVKSLEGSEKRLMENTSRLFLAEKAPQYKVIALFLALFITLLPAGVFAQKYDAEHITLAKKYIELIGIEQIFESSRNTNADSMKELIKTNNPKLKKESIDKITDNFITNFNVASIKDVKTIIIDTTIETFTKEELIYSNAFYETELGKSILKKTHSSTTNMVSKIEKALEENVISSMKITVEEMKKIGIRFKQ